MGKKLLAQVIDDGLPDPGHAVDPVVAADPLDDRDSQVGQDGVAQDHGIAGGEAAVDGDLDEVRAGHRGGGGDQHQERRKDHLAQVGPGEGDQPPGGLRVDALVVEFLGLGDVSRGSDGGHRLFSSSEVKRSSMTACSGSPVKAVSFSSKASVRWFCWLNCRS